MFTMETSRTGMYMYLQLSNAFYGFYKNALHTYSSDKTKFLLCN